MTEGAVNGKHEAGMIGKERRPGWLAFQINVKYDNARFMKGTAGIALNSQGQRKSRQRSQNGFASDSLVL